MAIASSVRGGSTKFGCSMDSGVSMQKNKNAHSYLQRTSLDLFTPTIDEFTKACEDGVWNHDKSTPHQSET